MTSRSSTSSHHHVRQTSEPFRMVPIEGEGEEAATTTSSSNHNGTNNKNRTNHRRRDDFHRHLSIGNLCSSHGGERTGSAGGHHSRDSSRASVDLENLLAFQESWTNNMTGGGGDFLLGGPTLPHPLKKASTTSTALMSSFGSTTPNSYTMDQLGMSSMSSAVAFLPDLNASSISSSAAAAASTGAMTPAVSSAIHDAARITDWDTVLELCDSQPEAASYSGRDGWTALHHACNRRCPRPDVVEALIRAYPEALVQEEEKSWLPLHYACRFKAPKEVVRLLLHMVPESGKIAVETRDRQGRRPLYYAIRYDAPEGVAGLLLAVDPSAVLDEDQNEESPLALIWDQWAEKLEGKRIVHSFLPGGFPEPEDTTVEERAVVLRQRLHKEPKLKRKWDKVNMLLKAAFGFPFEDDEQDEERKEAGIPLSSEHGSSSSQGQERKWRIVHATAAVKCHLSLFLLACALHPEQAKEFCEWDLRRPVTAASSAERTEPALLTALHLAASSNAGGEPGKTVVITLLSLFREAAQHQDGIDGSLPLHLMVENPRKQDWPDHAAILYHFYPRAVQIADRQGRLPLHRSAVAVAAHENNRHAATNDQQQERSVIIQLVRSFPQAASHLDTKGCLPMHYLAMNAKVWNDDVEAVHNCSRNGVQARAGPRFDGRLPIHMASASRKSRESLIQRLLQLHPRSSTLEDRKGKLPLHIACEEGKAWSDGTSCIHESFPNAIRQPENNSRGWLPLHLACASRFATAELIAKLVELYPEAADTPDNEGRYPLHLACSAGKCWRGGLEALFDASPNALASEDSRGLLPLHICALSYCKKEHETIKVKTKAVPKVEAKKELTVCTKEAAELDVIFNLVRADPSTIHLS